MVKPIRFVCSVCRSFRWNFVRAVGFVLARDVSPPHRFPTEVFPERNSFCAKRRERDPFLCEKFVSKVFFFGFFFSHRLSSHSISTSSLGNDSLLELPVEIDSTLFADNSAKATHRSESKKKKNVSTGEFLLQDTIFRFQPSIFFVQLLKNFVGVVHVVQVGMSTFSKQF